MERNKIISLKLDKIIVYFANHKPDNIFTIALKHLEGKLKYYIDIKHPVIAKDHLLLKIDPTNEIRIYDLDNKNGKTISYQEFKFLFDVNELTKGEENNGTNKQFN